MNAKASTPGSRNSISNCRSAMGFGCRISWYSRCSVTVPLPCVVDVSSVGRARRLSIDQHAKSHGGSRRRRAHDEMKIAGVKAVRDAAIGLVQRGGIPLHRPIAGQRPIVQAQAARADHTCEACRGTAPPGDAKSSVRS